MDAANQDQAPGAESPPPSDRPRTRMSTPFQGALVRTLREARGWSATELCSRINGAGHRLSLAGLTRIERGGGTSPATAKAIADALDQPLDQLLVTTPRRRRKATERSV